MISEQQLQEVMTCNSKLTLVNNTKALFSGNQLPNQVTSAMMSVIAEALQALEMDTATKLANLYTAATGTQAQEGTVTSNTGPALVPDSTEEVDKG